jgi:hypothetical protein
MKTCTKCGETKPLVYFYKDSQKTDGRRCWCKRCARAYTAAHYASLEGKAQRAAYNASPERKARNALHNASPERKVYNALYRASPGGKRSAWRRHVRNKYGLTDFQWAQMYADQGGKCAVRGCETYFNRGEGVETDHCHDSAVVRGLICTRCNQSLGKAEEDPNRLRGLADYAERWAFLK